uniref:uncharacterized protein LOC120344360 isoform X1 n=1 Tax=Styela clava TaxID=7725 RepID=UPI001939FE52|nr:uncharacterized protein LOC120344360 isoform X1 [Styela clava]XP_039269485.1 uncharacterized protein LOC120344360 isoform X2 [Styela clava]
MKLKINKEHVRPSPVVIRSSRRSFDLSILKKKRFSFGRKRTSSPPKVRGIHQRSVDEQEQTTRNLLQGSQTSIVAALLGTWKAEDGTSKPETETKTPRRSSINMKFVAGNHEPGTFTVLEAESVDDMYVTLRPSYTSSGSMQKFIRDDSPLPKKSMFRSVKKVASTNTTRLISSPLVQQLRRVSSKSVSPNRRKRLRLTSDYAGFSDLHPNLNEEVILKGLRTQSSGIKFGRPQLITSRSSLGHSTPERYTTTHRVEPHRGISPMSFKKQRTSSSPRSFQKYTSLPLLSRSPQRDSLGPKAPRKKQTRTSAPTPPHQITFDIVLNNQELLNEFRSFLKKEFSDENLDFWQECECYKAEKMERQPKIAHKLYIKYLKPMSPREVNVDGKIREEISRRILNADKETFFPAQNQIYKLMQNDSFPRFRSDRLK